MALPARSLPALQGSPLPRPPSQPLPQGASAVLKEGERRAAGPLARDARGGEDRKVRMGAQEPVFLCITRKSKRSFTPNFAAAILTFLTTLRLIPSEERRRRQWGRVHRPSLHFYLK